MTRPIEMTRTNAGESSVTLSFYAKIGALVPVGGVVEIYFPAGFTYTANGNAVGYH